MHFENLWKYFAITLCLLLILSYLKNYVRTVILALKLPGPPVLPFLGNAWLINKSKNFEAIGTNAFQWYGSLMVFWVSILPIICVYEPRHLKVILASNKLSKKNIFYTILHNLVGKGLITNNGHQWKKNRKLIQPYFSMSVLETFVGTFWENSQDVLEQLKEGSDIKITPIVNNFVVRTLHKIVLGVPLRENEESPFRKGKVAFTLRISRPWLLIESIFKLTSLAEIENKKKTDIHEYTRDILRQRIEDQQKSFKRKESTNFLDMLTEISENNPEFTKEDIIDECCTFMLAGQDSVATAIAFTLYYLAKHQSVQKKVVEELKTIFTNNKSTKTTMNQLNQMKYLEQCIKETLRLTPSVPILGRVLNEDITLDNYTIPAGTNICMLPFATQRLPHVFPNPLKFDPDRFSPDNLLKMHPYAFIAFSSGPRNCIGFKFAYLKIKSVISTILRSYHLELCSGKEELNMSYMVTLRANGGVWLRVKKRSLFSDT